MIRSRNERSMSVPGRSVYLFILSDEAEGSQDLQEYGAWWTS
jgi:hypothetical protein